MKKFYIGENKYLEQKVLAFYNCDYVWYKKQGNPDFINHLKNMTNQYNELDLVEDFVQVSERFVKDMESLFDKGDYKNFIVCVMPRFKRENKYLLCGATTVRNVRISPSFRRFINSRSMRMALQTRRR